MTNARRLLPKLLLFALSTMLFSADARAASLYYLFDGSGARIATIDPMTLNTAIPASQLKPGAVTSKLFPNYASGTAVSAGVEYGAAGSPVVGPGWLVVIFQGGYRNSARILVGPEDQPPFIEVFRVGDDINGNTKAVTAVIPIPARTRFFIENGITQSPIGANPGDRFENLDPAAGPGVYDPNAARFFRVDR